MRPSPPLHPPKPTRPGPAFHNRNSAKVLLAPDTPAVRQLASLVAAAVSCPDQGYKRICSPDTINTFGCLFGVSRAPPQCAVRCIIVAAAGIHSCGVSILLLWTDNTI